jgi:hypothetical protein
MNMKFDAEERQQISRDFHERLLDISQERCLLEFTIRRCKMGRISYLVIGLKESKHLTVEHQTCTLFAKPPIDKENSKENSKEIIEFSAD